MKTFDELKLSLKEKCGYCVSNYKKTQLICKCPWCEKDSTKNHGHLYIYFDNEKILPSSWCFKCNIVRNLDVILKQYKININEYFTDEVINNKRKRKDICYYEDISEIKSLNVINDYSNRYKNKILYLQSRLGVNYDLDGISGLVFNIIDFINKNNIELDFNKKNKLDLYDSEYVGFLSTLKSSLILRNINVTENNQKRYDIIPLIKDKRIFRDFYGVTFSDNLNDKKYIVVCEGIFDLLVAKESDEFKNIVKNSISFNAILGSYYKKTILSILNHHKMVKSDIIILSDKDKDLDYYKNLKNQPFINSCKIFWNGYGKDFGEKPIKIVKKFL